MKNVRSDKGKEKAVDESPSGAQRWPEVRAIVTMAENAVGNEGGNIGGKEEIKGARAKLWSACAGVVEQVPNVGDLVYYFPQGHIEHTEASVKIGGEFQVEMHRHNLPYKILCRVTQVTLLVEDYTDEVFAQINVVPVDEKAEMEKRRTSSGKGAPSSSLSLSHAARDAARVFSKKLTTSDTNAHASLFIQKYMVGQCFPPLDKNAVNPSVDFEAKDLHGVIWEFRHAYRGQPRRHLATSGWNRFVNTKKLVAGDIIIFVRGEDGQLYMGYRRGATKVESEVFAPVVSCSAMQHGLLTTASQAISGKTVFTVYSRPWQYPMSYLVPYDQYMKARAFNYGIGMRIRMQYVSSDTTYRDDGFSTVAGTIAGIEEIDPLRWPGSDWRCVRVNWDRPMYAEGIEIPFPERVSPWTIEPFTEIPTCRKRRKAPAIVVRRKVNPLIPFSIPLPCDQSAGPSGVKDRLGNYLSDDNYYSGGSSVVLQEGREATVEGTNNGSEMSESGLSSPNMVQIISRDEVLSEWAKDLQLQPPADSRNVNDTDAVHVQDHPFVRTWTQVRVHGQAVERAVEISSFNGYEELVIHLDKLFGLEGRLMNGSYHVTFTDANGKIHFLGDHRWPKFLAMIVTKLSIDPCLNPRMNN